MTGMFFETTLMFVVTAVAVVRGVPGNSLVSGGVVLGHPHHSNGNSHMALGDRRSENITAGSALECARGRQPRLCLAVRCGDLAL